MKKSDIIKLQQSDEAKYGWQDLVYSGYIEYVFKPHYFPFCSGA